MPHVCSPRTGENQDWPLGVPQSALSDRSEAGVRSRPTPGAGAEAAGLLRASVCLPGDRARPPHLSPTTVSKTGWQMLSHELATCFRK